MVSTISFGAILLYGFSEMWVEVLLSWVKVCEVEPDIYHYAKNTAGPRKKVLELTVADPGGGEASIV